MSDYPRGEWCPRQSRFLTSRVRAFETPPYVVRRTRDAFLYDIDGYKYIDFWLGGGEVLLGYKPLFFQRLKNALSRTFYGAVFSLSHLRLEKRMTAWLEGQGVRFQSVRFFDHLWQAFLFLQEYLGFQGCEQRVWSVALPSWRPGGEVTFFESVNQWLEDVSVPGGVPVLVENACLGRLSGGLSRVEGWEFLIIGGVIGNGSGGAVLVSREKELPPSPSLSVVHATAMTMTLDALLDRQSPWPWPRLPASFRQRGGMFLLPDGVSPESLLASGIVVRSIGMLSWAHGEHEIRRLVRSVQGQGDPSVHVSVPS